MNTAIGPALMRLRERAQVTNKELGEILGISQSSVSRYQAEDANPQWDTVVRMLKALDATVFDLAEELETRESLRATSEELAEIRARLAAIERVLGDTVADREDEMSDLAKRLLSDSPGRGGQRPHGSSSIRRR